MIRIKTRRIINMRDWLLIIGLILAPMTGFRVWKVGPAEVLCLLWVFPYINIRVIKINSILKFYAVFLVSMLLGSFWCMMVSPEELSIPQWFTWIYLTIISLGLYEGLNRNSIDYNKVLFDSFARGSAVWYLFLYVYSITVSRRFLGAPLWFSGYRFTGGATNPHQIAVLMCGLTFCFTRYVFKFENPIINAIFASICVFIVSQTASSTGIAALVIAFIFTIFLITGHTIKNRRKRYIIYFIEVLLIFTCVVLRYRYLYSAIYGWILSDRNGLGRLNLIQQIGSTFRKSPLFGLGPGAHAHDLSGRIKEFHNTYLEIISTSGLFGIIALIMLTIRAVKRMLIDDLLVPILIAIYAYGLGGFAMRRLAYWGLFIFVFVLAEQMNYERTAERESI